MEDNYQFAYRIVGNEVPGDVLQVRREIEAKFVNAGEVRQQFYGSGNIGLDMRKFFRQAFSTPKVFNEGFTSLGGSGRGGNCELAIIHKFGADGDRGQENREEYFHGARLFSIWQAG